jgi:hypothetical protein
MFDGVFQNEICNLMAEVGIFRIRVFYNGIYKIIKF